MEITSQNHPWEGIFQRDGRTLVELLPAFHRAAERFAHQHYQTILDLGCGCGRHLVGFSRQGFQVSGMDISTTGLSLTQAWLKEEGQKADLVQGDFRRNLPFRDDCFQGIFSTQVIHHALLGEIHLAIREIWRVLRPGGLAFITVAARKSPNLPFQEIEPGTFLPLDGDEQGLPHHIFSLAELRQEFSHFEILDLEPRDDGRVLIIWAKKPT
jgi:SAM-dependent methyltransferase